MNEKLTVGSCFSGIGGLELGLEWTGGFETKWQIEMDSYATKVLEKNWPNVKRYGDITEIECLKEQMLLSVDSLAKISAQPAGVPELPAPVLASGNGYYAPFAWYDHGSHLWRTFQCSLTGGWEPFLGIWPSRGMTRNGIAFQLVKSERHMCGKGCSLWPTPCATELKRGGVFGGDSEETGTPNTPSDSTWWKTEPRVDRVANGIPFQVHRVGSLGNAVVPYVSKKIGEMILSQTG